MTTKYTPGKWTVEQPLMRGMRQSIVSCGYDGKTNHKLIIAHIDNVDGFVTPEIDCDSGDNARLIAAAPELLEACRLALGAFEANRIDMQQNAERKLNAAIAKAEGK